MIRALVTRIREYGDPSWSEPMARTVQPIALLDEPKPESLRRVAMHQHTPEEWQEMIEDAEYDYYRLAKQHCLLYRIFWGSIGGIVLAVDECYKYLSAMNREP